MFLLEVSTYNIEGVIAARQYGVSRLELCSNIKEGGVTPSYGFIRAAVETGHPNICIIVRPRGGDFLYTSQEFEMMQYDILNARQLGVHGVVSGVLHADGSIDKARTKQLVDLARPMKFTFHRAFDMCNNPVQALNDLIEIGVDTILTSGMENTAIQGKKVLKELIAQANGRIEILAGSGVNAENMAELYFDAGVVHFHMSAVKDIQSEMEFFNYHLNMGNEETEEYVKLTVDDEKIQKALRVLKELAQAEMAQ